MKVGFIRVSTEDQNTRNPNEAAWSEPQYLLPPDVGLRGFRRDSETALMNRGRKEK